MGRPRKEYIPINIKMDAEIAKRLMEYCEEVGQTKTMAIERMISAFLDEYNEKR